MRPGHAFLLWLDGQGGDATRDEIAAWIGEDTGRDLAVAALQRTRVVEPYGMPSVVDGRYYERWLHGYALTDHGRAHLAKLNAAHRNASAQKVLL